MSGKRIHLSVVTSTNIHSNALLSQSDILPFTVVSADFQSAGKGQRGKNWQSEHGRNLLFSIILKPGLPLESQYFLSATASMALVNALSNFNIGAQIKWPNDIIVNDSKIAGLLIENHTRANEIEWSIIGIGLNINQTEFEPFPWPATSMKNEIKGSPRIDREEVLDSIVGFIRRSMEALAVNITGMMKSVNDHLYGKDEVWSINSGGVDHTGVIRSVKPSGALVVEVDGKLKSFVNGEIKLNRISSASPRQEN